jgi:hypothetical protein
MEFLEITLLISNELQEQLSMSRNVRLKNQV